ncbi:hypothetical protein B0J11DRAFT_89690 [Dendryphion nanum]|uniref:Subtilisin-like serine protease n=1 Tax=Dendryphion nanum TaxID=256645 RepID=A0A9P9DET6_9PLEO|nr:hypothetical protein B0J11DRAFT_89690 [Dendryphion nanum]
MERNCYMSIMPIIHSGIELNKELTFVTSVTGDASLHRVCGGNRQCLPGQARITLDNANLKDYLRSSFLTSHLDIIAPYLWMAFTPTYTHISPIHFQAARGRNIITTENVHLHLVWYYDRIFIQPLPAYLLSSAFWEYIEETDQEVYQAAAGFMRTYSCLIKYEIDFRRAQSPELGLIPTGDSADPITYEKFVEFIAPFADLVDSAVSPRYQYGEMRLTRLNWFARIFLRKLTYHHIHAQWNEYIGRFLAPFLTIFILLSSALAAMQVELTVQSAPPSLKNWDAFARVCRWFSVLVLVLIAVIVTYSLSLVLFMFVYGQFFARRVLRQKRATQGTVEQRLQSAVV